MPVDTRHRAIADMLPEWVAIRDVLAGKRRVKARQATQISTAAVVTSTSPYLPRLPGQPPPYVGPSGDTIDEYGNYLYRAVLLPFAGPLVMRMCGLVFKQPPKIEPEALRPVLENITGDGVTADAFAWQLLATNVTTGFGAMLVTWSDLLGYPVIQWYPDESVVDFQFTTVSGRPILRHVRLYEEITESTADEFVGERVEQYRVIELTTDIAGLDPVQQRTVQRRDRYPAGYCRHRLFRRERDAQGRRSGAFVALSVAEQPPLPTRAGAPLGFLPVVPQSPLGARWEIVQPPLSYLTDLLLAAFRNSADYEQLLHECSAGTVMHGSGFSRAEQTAVGRVGGGSLVFSEAPESRLQYVQTTGQSAKELLEAMQEKKSDMAVAAGRLLLSQQKNVAESGAALGLQFAGDDATLQVIAGSTARAFEEALHIVRWWLGTMPAPADATDVRVTLAEDFVVTPAQAQEVVAWITARDLNGMTDRDLFWNLKRGQALDPDTTFEQWSAARRRTESPPSPATPADNGSGDGMMDDEGMSGDA